MDATGFWGAFLFEVRARAGHVYARSRSPFKFVCPSTFVHALMPAQRGKERDKERKRERERGEAGKEGEADRGERQGTRVPSWFFECSKNIPSTRGKIKRPAGMAGDSEGPGESAREKEKEDASREKAKEPRRQRRDWECQSSAASHPRNVLASVTATGGNVKKERNRNRRPIRSDSSILLYIPRLE